jgi:hypothetical protein
MDYSIHASTLLIICLVISFAIWIRVYYWASKNLSVGRRTVLCFVCIAMAVLTGRFVLFEEIMWQTPDSLVLRDPNRDELKAPVALFYLSAIHHIPSASAFRHFGDQFGCLFEIGKIGPYDKQKKAWFVEARLTPEFEKCNSPTYHYIKGPDILNLQLKCDLMPNACQPKHFAVYKDAAGEWAACFFSDREEQPN